MLIDGIGRQMADLSGNGDSKPAAQEDHPALTALTGARTPVVWFKICPVLLACSAVLLLTASLL